MSTEAKQIITAMREWLDEHGWVQGMLYLYNSDELAIAGRPSSACLRGACNLAAGHPFSWAGERVAAVLLPVIEELFPGRAVPKKIMQFDPDGNILGLKASWVENSDPTAWDKVIGFNDDPETTKEDVLLVLKHASE